MAITVKEAQTLYVSYFGRPADFVGLQYWTGTDTIVGSLEQLAHSFYNSAEGKKYFPEDPATGKPDFVESINAIYANMFGRVPDTAGFDYWYNELNNEKITIAEAAVAIYKGAQGKDALMIENKIAAATQFTDQVAASGKPSLYYGDQAFAKANEFLNTVTDTTDVTSAGFAAQVNAAVNVAEAAGGASSSEGGIFTLTTDSNGNLLTTSGILTNEANVGFEVPTGQSKYLTAGNDVVDLSKWNGSGSVNIGDAFSGDNDKVTVMASALQNNGLKLTSIENLEIVNSGTTASVALNNTNFKGLEAIKLIGDATILNVSDLTQGVKIDATANADYIFGSDKADTINGGAGNDTIVGNDGNDVLTGGNGADEFVVGTVKAAGVDQILDFSAEDKISMKDFVPGELKKFDASTFSTVTYKTLDSVLATFATGGANATKTGDVVIFSYDGKTYALLANDPFTETGSALVDITGANVASLTESNFGGATSPTPPTPIPPAPPVTIYSNYADFVNAVAFGTIPAGNLAEISTLTGQEAGLLAVNKTYLDKIAAGGIKNVTSDIVVTVGTGADNLSNNFDSTEFGTKLAVGALGSNVMNINGSTKNDVIVTSFGGTINGNDGADTITVSAAAGAVTINGGNGDNVITANAAATITGGNNVDTIYVNAGGSVDGGSGADKIYVSGSANATINGGSGDDIINASAATGNVTIEGGSGADVITAGASKDTFVQANNTSVAPSAMTINGSNIAADDTLTFANGVDIIQGFGSDDVIKGGTGATKTTALNVAKSGGFTDNTTYYLSGNFVADTGVFTVTDDGVGVDTLVFIAKGANLTQTTDLTGAVVLVGVGSNTLSASNFEVA